MDSVLGEDVTLPAGLNGGSVLISNLPDGSDIDPNFGLGSNVFPNASEETVSPTRVRNMKDFENQITDLKKENFNLKLRIYFLEERIQQKFDSPNEDVYKINIELKVELESLKRELQEREYLLIKASKAVESLAEGGGSEIQRVKEDAHKKMQQVEDHLTRKIFHLEEDVKAAQAEVEKAFAMAEKEKVLRMGLEEKLSSLKTVQQGDLEEVLSEEDKDRLIEDLRLTLKKKDALIQELEEAKSQMGSPDEKSSGKLGDLTAAFREEKELEIEAVQLELRNERNCFEKKILSFQEDIKEKEKEIALEKKNGLKRDKTIQGLTVALKTKDKEIEELTSEIEELTTSLAKAREATHSAQIEKIKGTEDFETILLEKETLLTQLHAENRRKDTENHKLQRAIEKFNQDLDDFQHEREKLEKELDEARRQKSHGDKTINVDLRNQVEKLHGEMIEKEKSVEQRYSILLSESNQKLQSQEQVMKCLTDNVNQKDILLQRLDGKIKEKDVELEQLCNRLNHLLKAKEDLELKNEDLTEKYAQQLSVKKALSSEEKQGSEYEELIHALKKEQHIYSDLVKALKDSDSINNLQAELNNIFSLRKQLEDDVLSYQTLRKTLEDQINEIKRQEEESISFYSDQTSYLSICIGDHDRFQTEHLSLEELKQRVNELVMIVKELHSDNQDLKKTLFELSCLGTQESGSLAQSEILGSKDDEEDATKAEDIDDDEKNLLSSPHSMWGSETTLEYSKPFSKNGYSKNQDASQLDFDVVGDSYSHKDKCQHGVEEMKLFPSPLSENRTSLLEPRPELMKAISELLLEHLGMTEQELSGCDLEDKNEKTLKQIIIQLRTELRRFKQVNKFLRQHIDLKSVFDGKERFYPAATAHLNKAIELSMVEVKDSVTQTMNPESYTMKFRHEGKKDAAEEKPKYSVLNAEHQHENVYKMPEQHNVLPLPSTIHKSTKKSRLPIPLKSSRSLGSVNLNSSTQETMVYLQNQIAELHGHLKECSIRNKHLQQKLSLTEALIEERSMQDILLLNAEPSSKAVCQESKVELKDPEGDAGGKEEKEDENQRKSPEPELYQLKNFDILPSNKESHCEDFIDGASTVSYASSKNFSLQVNVNGTDLSDEFDVDDAEHLRQRIRDLKTELEGYQKFIFHLQASKQSQCSKAIITVLCGTEETQEGQNKSKGGTHEEEMKTFSSLHQVQYVKHTKILHPLTSELADGIVEELKQQLEEQGSELKKEQNMNMSLLEEVHNLQNKLRESSPTRYDSLVQSQARELSSQRQQIKDSHSICVIYRQHMTNLIKAFEELLQASDVDYYVAEGFREQLNQSIQLLEKLEKMFLNGDNLPPPSPFKNFNILYILEPVMVYQSAKDYRGKSSDREVSKHNELIKRASEDITVYPSLNDRPTILPASQVLSDYEISEKSSFDSGEHKQDSEDIDKSSIVANNFSQDLLMEHLQEIRTLRQRLEESIKTNDRLRKQLEHQGGELEQGSANIFLHGSEQHNSLTSEIHFLRKQNQALNVMLAKGSRDKQKENEKLRESLSRKTVIIEHLQRDYECIKQENERLQKQVSEKEKDNRHLTHAIYSSHHELNRIQAEMKVQQRQYAENAKLLQSLRVELKVYEKLEEANRRQIEPRQDMSEECRKEQNHLLDLHELLTEIQNLRVQLERSIETNNALRNKLEEQLSKGMDTMAAVSPLTTPSLPQKEWQLCPGNNVDNEPSTEDKEQCELSDQSLAQLPQSEKPEVSGGDMDSSSCCSSSSAHSIPCTPRLVPGHRMWANKSGRHILGLIEDYNALRKQICEGQKLLSEMEAHLQLICGPKNQETGLKVPDQAPLNGFSDSVNTAQQILEEAARLLKLLWRVSLPINGHCPVHSNQIAEMKAEIIRLRKKISEQEKKLYSTARHLQSRKHQEKVIFDQLVLTHEILRKARGNLELKPGGPSLGTASSCGSES